MFEALLPYTPPVVVRHYGADHEGGPRARCEIERGAVMSVDIEGFTRLAQALAAEQEGVSRTARLLNSYFAPLIQLIESHGGEVAKFGGDQLLVLWTDARFDEPPRQLVQRATRCALALQERLGNYRVQEDRTLHIHVGIDAGDIRLLHLGGQKRRWELVAAGMPVENASAAERYSRDRSVILCKRAWKLIAGDARAASLDVGPYYRVESLRSSPDLVPYAPAEFTPNLEETLRSFIAGTIVSRYVTGALESWLAERLPVTVLFVRMPGLHRCDDLSFLQDTILAFQEAIYDCEGSLNKIHVDYRGFVAVAGWGLPPIAITRSSLQATRAAFACQKVLEDRGIEASQGIASGTVFAGPVGGETRREYTIIGRTVNLAARLMQRGTGGILCDEPTFFAVQSNFDCRPRQIRLPDDRDPITAYEILDRRDSPDGDTQEIVGREHARKLLQDGVADLFRRGIGGTVILEGEAGFGKSKLVQHLLQEVRSYPIRALTGYADAIHRSEAFFAWRGVFRALLLHTGDDGAPGASDFFAELEQDPDLASLLPLLRTVVPSLPLRDNDLTRQMDGEARANNTRFLLLRILQAFVKRSEPKALVVLEDAHWFDSASWTLCLLFHLHVPDAMLVITTRPTSSESPPEYEELVRDDGVCTLTLDELSEAEIDELVRVTLGARTVPSEITEPIRKRVGGNPYFAKELANYGLSQGAIAVREGKAVVLKELDRNLPVTILQLLNERLLKLTLPQQDVARFASVIGRVFLYRTLYETFPFPEHRSLLPDHIDALCAHRITEVETPEPELSHSFCHALLHRAAYDRQVEEQRVRAHLLVAEWYERQVEDRSACYIQLAHHYHEARVYDKALRYRDLAGEQALRTGAYREAIDAYRKVLELDGQREHASTDLQYAIWESQLGEAYAGQGDHPEAREHLQKALAHLHLTVPRKGLGRLVFTAGQIFRLMWPWKRSPGQPESGGDGFQRLRVACSALVRLSQNFYFSNEVFQTLLTSIVAGNRTRLLGDSPELARAYANLTMLTGTLRLFRVSDRYDALAQEAALAANSQPARAWVLELNGGLYRMGRGQWERAEEDLSEARRINQRFLDRRRLAESSVLLGVVYYLQGRIRQGSNLFEEILRTSVRHGDPQVTCWAHLGRLTGLLRTGDLDAVPALLEQTSRLVESTRGVVDVRTWARGVLARAWLQVGEVEDARLEAIRGANEISRLSIPLAVYTLHGFHYILEVLLDLVEQGTRNGEPVSARMVQQIELGLGALRRYKARFSIGEPAYHECRGRLHALLGHRRRARRHLRRSIRWSEALSMPYEEALARFALGRHDLGRDSKENLHILESARMAFHRIGAQYDRRLVETCIADQGLEPASDEDRAPGDD